MLFREYAAELGVDLCFQGFEAELERLPELYGPPTGCLLLARADERMVGCGALRRLSDGVCEMKRLYVRAEARGTGLGRILAERLLATRPSARLRVDAAGHARALDRGRELYRSLGFAEIAAYYDSPLADAVYMELDLRLP